jgi:hypothetical protein
MYTISKKLLFISSLLTIIILTACSKPQVQQPPKAQACTEEAKMCPD